MIGLGSVGPMETMIIMGIAVLLFGKRLPEVGRSLGKGIVEFKKGLRGIEENFDMTSDISSHTPSRRGDDRSSSHRPGSSDDASSSSSVPKFEPPTSAPVPQMEYTLPAPKD